MKKVKLIITAEMEITEEKLREIQGKEFKVDWSVKAVGKVGRFLLYIVDGKLEEVRIKKN